MSKRSELTCAGCGKPLLAENAWMEDGCPCNSPRGVNAAETTNYTDVRRYIEDGDMLAFRGDPLGLIATEGRSIYSHIATAAWRRSDQHTLLCAESRELVGARLTSLSAQVRAFPGMIDVYRPTYQCPHGVRERAATIAVNWAGRAYGYPTAFRMSLYHAPILRRVYQWWTGERFEPTDMTLSPWDEPKVCSQLHAWAYRWAMKELQISCGWDPCPGRGDRWIEPADLVHNGSYRLVAKGLVIA